MKPWPATLTTLVGFLGMGGNGVGAQPSTTGPAPAQAAPEAKQHGPDKGGTEAQWQALKAFSPRLPEALERVRLKAAHLGLKGWPEFPSDENADRGGRKDLGDPLLNRVWSHPRVLWHANASGQILDALVGMQSSKSRDTNQSTLVFVEDVFGTCKVTSLQVPIHETPLYRSSPDDISQGHLPRFIKTGEVWVFYQESDGSLGPVISVFHPQMGVSTLLTFVESPEQHRQAKEKDELIRQSLLAKGEPAEEVDEEMAYQSHECSGFLTTDLPDQAPVVGGMRWFKVGGARFAATERDWQRWHSHKNPIRSAKHS